MRILLKAKFSNTAQTPFKENQSEIWYVLFLHTLKRMLSAILPVECSEMLRWRWTYKRQGERVRSRQKTMLGHFEGRIQQEKHENVLQLW